MDGLHFYQPIYSIHARVCMHMHTHTDSLKYPVYITFSVSFSSPPVGLMPMHANCLYSYVLGWEASALPIIYI